MKAANSQQRGYREGIKVILHRGVEYLSHEEGKVYNGVEIIAVMA
jgi:hypothetical protein